MSKGDCDLENWRERFFGFIPKRKASLWFLVGNVIFILSCMYLWPLLPGRLVFGWWPLHHFVINLVFTNVGVLLWGIYYYRWWPELSSDPDEKGDVQV